MRSKVELSGEQGLLALAFHPDYEHNRKFYVLYTEKGTGDVIVAEYRASTSNRNKAAPSTFRRLLRVGHRVNTNHNGGMLAFGSKGYLYISIGDGGGGGDTPNNAQTRTTLLGKIAADRRQRAHGPSRLSDPTEQPLRHEPLAQA